MPVDNKPNIEQLKAATTLAADSAVKAGVELSANDLKDMTDDAVSSKDMAIANGWVGVLTGYLDEGSFTHKLTRLGLTKLPKDLSREKALEMLAAAKELQAAVSEQLDAQGLTTTLWEETKDEFRTPVRFARAVRAYFGSDSE